MGPHQEVLSCGGIAVEETGVRRRKNHTKSAAMGRAMIPATMKTTSRVPCNDGTITNKVAAVL
jgi:hypothetical protein